MLQNTGNPDTSVIFEFNLATKQMAALSAVSDFKYEYDKELNAYIMTYCRIKSLASVGNEQHPVKEEFAHFNPILSIMDYAVDSKVYKYLYSFAMIPVKGCKLDYQTFKDMLLSYKGRGFMSVSFDVEPRLLARKSPIRTYLESAINNDFLNQEDFVEEEIPNAVYPDLEKLLRFSITNQDRQLSKTGYTIPKSSKTFKEYIIPQVITINLHRQAGHSVAMVNATNSLIDEGKRVAIISYHKRLIKHYIEIGLSDKVSVFFLPKLAAESRGYSNPDVVFIDGYMFNLNFDKLDWGTIREWYAGSIRDHGVFAGLS